MFLLMTFLHLDFVQLLLQMIQLLSCSRDELNTMKPFYIWVEGKVKTRWVSKLNKKRYHNNAYMSAKINRLTYSKSLSNRLDRQVTGISRWKLLWILSILWACLRCQTRTVLDRSSHRQFRQVFVIQPLDTISTTK